MNNGTSKIRSKMLIYYRNKNKSVKQFISGLFIGILMIMALSVNAQITSIQSVFFQNQYLINPAMAGIDTGLNLNMSYHKQWLDVPGSPRLTSFTADYNSGK